MFGRRNAQDYADKAAALHAAGNIPKAMEHIRKAIKLDPNHSQALYIQGCVLLESGNLEPAIDSFRKSFEHAPPENAHLPLYNLGQALQQAGQIEAAIEAFDGVIRLRPDDADAWINKGRLLDDSGKHEEAIKHYKRALKLAPEDSIAWSNSGNSLMALKYFDKALKCYDRALKFDPANGNARRARYICLRKKRAAESRE